MDKKVANKVTATELEIMSQYLSNYTKAFHVRELARILKANHRTISLALQRLEKRRILEHKMVGKSKTYTLVIRNIITKEYINTAESLKTMQLVEKHFIIKKLLTDISMVMKTTPIILFGSYAKGIERKGSDIDIIVIKDGNEKKIVSMIKNFAKTFNKRIHVQTVSKKIFEEDINKDHLIIEIVKDHIVLNNISYFTDVMWRYYNER
jgi:predicted nucleotidyltransferase